MLTGKDLITMGYKPGPHFAEMLSASHEVEIDNVDSIKEQLDNIYRDAMKNQPIPLKSEGRFQVYIEDGWNDFEKSNVEAVKATMQEVVKTPTVIDAMIMPDSCPAGPIGTIPVGGVVFAKNAIHPGMHSADICCSMSLTSTKNTHSVAKVLDAVQTRSHFGSFGRKDTIDIDSFCDVREKASKNTFLSDPYILKSMEDQFGTQGDGNHFFFVGECESTGDLTFVTHHGSRKPGALLYKAGMKVAENFRKKLAPAVLKQNAWIPFDSSEGQSYWEALQIIREWTKYNHLVIHDAVLDELSVEFNAITDRFWNEHNFVFLDGDVFMHAKGATPVFGNHAADADKSGRTIIPLNMGEPILIATNNKDNSTGFAPHGAGRNISRSQFEKLLASKSVDQIMQEQTAHFDARFFNGIPDISELPGAYKDATEVQRQIKDYKLANIVDRILPLGTMMAGKQYQPWLNKKKKKTQ